MHLAKFVLQDYSIKHVTYAMIITINKKKYVFNHVLMVTSLNNKSAQNVQLLAKRVQIQQAVVNAR